MLLFKIGQQNVDAYLWRLMKFSFHGTCKSGKGYKFAKLHFQYLKCNAAAVLALFVCVSVLSSCGSSSGNQFPKVTQPIIISSETTAESTPTPTTIAGISSDGATILTLAAPISNTTAQYLVKLYTAKESGNWSAEDSGSTVSLDKLDAVKPLFSVQILQTPSTGAAADTIQRWKDNGVSPDIIYTSALSTLAGSEDILPLSEYTASNPLFQPTNLYTPMLYSCRISNEIYGIPYSASAQILYVNMNVLNQAGVNTVPFDLDLHTLTTMSEDVKKLSGKDTPLEKQAFAFYYASELIPFLPSSYSPKSDWFMYNGSGFDFSSAAFSDSINFLRNYVKAGYSVESLTEEDQHTAFSSLDPRLSSRVAMWVGSSSDVSHWTMNQAYTLSIAQIPAVDSDRKSRLALTVYPLCVSSSTDNPKLACDFASFISLDEDAILLSSRLERLDGLLPVVSSNIVWESVCLQQTFGEELLLLHDKVPDAYYVPITNHENDYYYAQQLLSTYKSMLLDENTDLPTLINTLTNARAST